MWQLLDDGTDIEKTRALDSTLHCSFGYLAWGPNRAKVRAEGPFCSKGPPFPLDASQRSFRAEAELKCFSAGTEAFVVLTPGPTGVLRP